MNIRHDPGSPRTRGRFALTAKETRGEDGNDRDTMYIQISPHIDEYFVRRPEIPALVDIHKNFTDITSEIHFQAPE
jgi:hypothetical protein